MCVCVRTSVCAYSAGEPYTVKGEAQRTQAHVYSRTRPLLHTRARTRELECAARAQADPRPYVVVGPTSDIIKILSHAEKKKKIKIIIRINKIRTKKPRTAAVVAVAAAEAPVSCRRVSE